MKTPNNQDTLKDEYDFSSMSGGVKGKYVKEYKEGVNLVLLEPDVAKMFPDAISVNEALRYLSKIIIHHNKHIWWSIKLLKSLQFVTRDYAVHYLSKEKVLLSFELNLGLVDTQVF